MIIFTDGSCLKNGSENNEGGFGVVILDDNGNFIDCYQKQSNNTTNNAEELKAILYALLRFGKVRPAPIVYSDSAYCVNSLTQWLPGWARNNWTKSDGKSPENLELMKAFYEYSLKGYQIELVKVKGHAGNFWNEIADGLATNKLKSQDIRNKYRKEM